jgi:murein L,D-transpeptidase YcbB/YkuD
MARCMGVFLLFFVLLTQLNCNGKVVQEVPLKLQDTTVYSKVDYSNLRFDSSSVALFLSKELAAFTFHDIIFSFYQRRHYQAAWFNGEHLSEQAYNFISKLHEYKELYCDTALFNSIVCSIEDSIARDPAYLANNHPVKARLDFTLTASFFKYANKEYYGIDQSPKDLEWYIPRKKKDYLLLLEAITSNKKGYEQFEPLNAFYRNLKTALIAYQKIQLSGGFPWIDSTIKITPGYGSAKISGVKNYLKLTQDYALDDTNVTCNDSLVAAIKKFQNRMGLPASGLLDKATVREMNVPVHERMRTIMINLERLRWMPSEMPKEYFLVNIPEYRLHIFDSARHQWSMKVVVGKEATNTAIFADELAYVVFSPYWNVPQSILVKEILPKLKRNPGWLRRNNMEVYSGNTILNEWRIPWRRYTTRVPYNVREKPGPKNSLGLVKFLFPNHFNIYMHDSPVKSLFEKNERAYSHGCIRLSEPERLANYIFRKDTIINADSIAQWMRAGKEKFVAVKPVPVFVVYFTAWVAHGQLNFRPDIYKRDEELAVLIFGK